jgi:DNA-directed RNA polymerase specialized sigma24 family protein
VQRGSPGWNADQALTVLYETHYRALTQLATLLVSDVATAEDMVQDAFVAMHGAWRQLRDGDRALLYLQQVVVRRARSGRPARGGPDGGAPGRPSAGRRNGVEPEPRLVAALRSLPARQREALVLRYYANLPEAQIGLAMGISGRAVSNHVARGMSALQAALERGHPGAGPPAAGAAGDASPA